jgi:hypothetical protein
MFKVPPEIQVVLIMLRTARSGEIPQALALAEKYVGRKLDMMLQSLLEGEFSSRNMSVIPVVLGGLNYHKDRLATPPARWYATRSEEVYRRLSKPPGRRLIEALRDYSDSPYGRLRTELPGAIMRAEAEGFFGCTLPRGAEEIIFRDARHLGMTRKRVEDESGVLREKFVLLSEVLADPTLDAYDGADKANALLDQLIGRAGLTPREREVVGLYRCGMKPKAIAGHLGVAPSTVYELLRRIRTAIKEAA